MKKLKLTAWVLCLLMILTLYTPIGGTAYATPGTYINVVVTGFNEDLIAEGEIATLSALEAKTTTCFDEPGEGINKVMYTTGFALSFNTNLSPFTEPLQALSYGLPNDGVINSVNLVGATYQLSDYTTKNAILLVNQDQTGTLTLTTPAAFQKLAILSSSAMAASTFTVDVNFSDETVSNYDFNVPDWYNGSNYAIKGFGRINRTTGVTDEEDAGTDNPRLYDNMITLSAIDMEKEVTSITFTKTSADGRSAILAVCGMLPAATEPSAYGVTVTGTTQAGFTLTGHYTFLDVNGDGEIGSTYKWYRCNDTSKTAIEVIAGATELTYTLQSADVGKYIVFEVTPGSSEEPTTGAAVQSNAIGPIVAAAATGHHHHYTVAPVVDPGPDNRLRFNVDLTDSYLTSGSAIELRRPMDVAPILFENRTLLPIRFVVEPLGGTVLWNKAEKKVTITRGDTTIELWIGNPIAKVNDIDKMIDPDNANVTPIVIRPGRTMLPLRFIAETLGCTVTWDQATQQILVTDW